MIEDKEIRSFRGKEILIGNKVIEDQDSMRKEEQGIMDIRPNRIISMRISLGIIKGMMGISLDIISEITKTGLDITKGIMKKDPDITRGIMKISQDTTNDKTKTKTLVSTV